ncbi:unnamed protein product [Pseudo-nitzschia multistriata]|uniref:Mitochondrial carrier protein n=1 Tax=Pseudo-nitzschia multistriata TaxID=183589 RepID=A0A448ZGK2_9STRA|nr:unnamed protein product [Pseudo-nitzschia multistriata]
MSLLTEEWWTDFVAGWVSGAVGVATCQPLDTVLTRFQAGRVLSAPGLEVAVQGGVTASAVRSSVRGLVGEFGLRSLWRGSSPMIGAVPVQNALLMGGYGFGKRYSEGARGADTGACDALLPVFVGGCAGGVLQSFLMSPVEWIKVQQQTHASSGAAATASSVSVLRRFLTHRHALWNRGLTATLLRDGIPHGVWFATYEFCKLRMLAGPAEAASGGTETPGAGAEDGPRSSLYKTVAVPVVSGAVAATTAWAVGYPFDIIKTRIQASADGVRVPPGVWETGIKLVEEANGNLLRGLYRGFGLKLLRSVPASMVGFFTYELVSGAIAGAGSNP